MANSQILSPKPSIDEALEFLGMASMDKAMGIQALLRISEYDGLQLFFDELLTCVPASTRYGDQYDDEGGFTETVLIKPEDEREFLSEHILDSFRLWKSPDGIISILVSRVIHDGIAYHVSHGDGTISEGEDIGYEKFYFDRNQLIDFKRTYQDGLSQSDNGQSNSSKKPSIMDQRITAFKYWLVGNSGRSIHNANDLQYCYETLGSPTKGQVLGQLQLMDRDLFSHGKDDFKKVMGKVIQFKVGTGKDRNR